MTNIINSIEYKLIPIDCNSKYLISKCGKLFSLTSNKILKKIKNSDGYLQHGLTINGKLKMIAIHRLLCLTYLDNKENKTHVNHKDGNKTNNCLSNLEWCTCKENIQHAYDTGLKSNKGDKHPRNKLTEAVVLELRKLSKTNKIKYSELSIEYGVNPTTISKAIRGITFAHI